MNRHGKTFDAIEERMQSGTFWSTTAKMCRGGSSAENWWTMFVPSSLSGVKTGPGPIQTTDRITRWETNTMMRLFRFKRGEDEIWVEHRTRCCKAAREMDTDGRNNC